MSHHHSDHHHHDHGHGHDHHHEHEHGHDHHAEHGHEHEHGHHCDHDAAGSEMPLDRKLAKLLPHWQRHNQDHADTYRQWSQRAREAGLTAVADRLEAAARQTRAVNDCFAQAVEGLGPAVDGQ